LVRLFKTQKAGAWYRKSKRKGGRNPVWDGREFCKKKTVPSTVPPKGYSKSNPPDQINPKDIRCREPGVECVGERDSEGKRILKKAVGY